jgi:hypothetical protein
LVTVKIGVGKVLCVFPLVTANTWVKCSADVVGLVSAMSAGSLMALAGEAIAVDANVSPPESIARNRSRVGAALPVGEGRASSDAGKVTDGNVVDEYVVAAEEMGFPIGLSPLNLTFSQVLPDGQSRELELPGFCCTGSIARFEIGKLDESALVVGDEDREPGCKALPLD